MQQSWFNSIHDANQALPDLKLHEVVAVGSSAFTVVDVDGNKVLARRGAVIPEPIKYPEPVIKAGKFHSQMSFVRKVS